jgi:apolipoprotein N-acyltransferase
MNAKLKDVVAAAATAALWAASFRPVHLPWLSLVALIPWLYRHATRPKDAPRADVLGFALAHYALHVYSLWWATTCAAPLAWAVALLGIPFSIATALLFRVATRRGFPLFVAAAGSIVFVELLRDYALTGLTWISLGYALEFWDSAVHLASIGRVHLVSIVAIAINVLLFEAWFHRRKIGATRARLIGLALLVAAVFAIGASVKSSGFLPGPRAAGLQPNVPQYARRREIGDNLRTHLRLLSGVDPSTLDLLVYSETSFPAIRHPEWNVERLLDYVAFRDLETGRPVRFRDGVLPDPTQTTLLGFGEMVPSESVGIPDLDGDGFAEWNVALALTGGAKEGIRYRKRGLAPFGEYIPFSGVAVFREWAAKRAAATLGHVPDLTPGEGPTFVSVRSPSGPRRAAITICFEIVFPKYFREAALDGADVVVNMSNDAWFPESSEQELVDQATRFRAVEIGRSIFRVSNTGISSCYAPDGTLLSTVAAPNGRRTEVEGLLQAEIPIAVGKTIFVRFGDAPLSIACGAFVAGLLFRRRNRADLPAP